MRVQAKINFNRTSDFILWLDGIGDLVESNVSNADNVLNNDELDGYKGFQLAGDYAAQPSLLDGTYAFFDDSGYPGYLSGVLSASARGFLLSSGYSNFLAILDGNSLFFDNNLTREPSEFAYQFINEITIHVYIKGKYPKQIYLTFDTTTNEYPVNFDIEYPNVWQAVRNNTSSVVTIPVREDMEAEESPSWGNALILHFYDWCAPGKSFQLTRISANYGAIYSGADLISITCSENLLDAQMKIAPGIVEQYADISIYDRDGVLHELALQDELIGDHKAQITAIDDTTEVTYFLGSYTVASWDISSESSVVSATCRDPSYIFEKRDVPSIPIQDRSVDDMLNLAFGYAGNVSWQYIDEDTRLYCMKVVTPHSWFYAGTLLTMLKKICSLGMLRIYWSINKFIVARCY
jgi:hypothetical protein